MVLLTFNGRAGGGAAGGINWICGVIGLRTEVGMAGAFMCACGWLKISALLEIAFTGGKKQGLIQFNCPGILNLRGDWLSNCKASKCIVP